MFRTAVAAMMMWIIATGVVAQESENRFTVRYAFKTSTLLSRMPDAPVLFPDRNAAAMFWRLRVEPTATIGNLTFETAVEPRVRLFSASGADAAIFGADAPIPWRVRPLEWSLGSAEHSEGEVEIDRAAVHARLPGVELTVGRQAIGWGRGVLFSAVDLFAPLTALEADREWRRGVDAVRADVAIGDRSGVDVVAAFGESIDQSTFAGRFRGYAGRADVEIVGGRRALDAFAGATSSVAAGDLEFHGELAVFRPPVTSGTFGRNTVVKALVGASTRLPIGNGLLLFAEYHYSGFGARTADGALAALADPSFRERYFRGDMQMLGRHALAAVLTYEQSPQAAWGLQWLQSPADGSGVVVPSTTLTMSDRWSVLIAGYVPYGRRASGTSFGSDFGAAPLALFTQLRVYR